MHRRRRVSRVSFPESKRPRSRIPEPPRHVLCDHDDGQIRSAGRHDRGVGDGQPFDAMNRSTSVGDGSLSRIRAYRARTDGMMECRYGVAHPRRQRSAITHRHAAPRRELVAGGDSGQWLATRNPPRFLDAIKDCFRRRLKRPESCWLLGRFRSEGWFHGVDSRGSSHRHTRVGAACCGRGHADCGRGPGDCRRGGHRRPRTGRVVWRPRALRPAHSAWQGGVETRRTSNAGCLADRLPVRRAVERRHGRCSTRGASRP